MMEEPFGPTPSEQIEEDPALPEGSAKIETQAGTEESIENEPLQRSLSQINSKRNDFISTNFPPHYTTSFLAYTKFQEAVASFQFP